MGILQACSATVKEESPEKQDILFYEVNPKQQNLKFYWKNKDGQPYKSFKSLKHILEKSGQKLVFAMNGGMYTKSHTPLGLYIENGKIKKQLNQVKNAYGNFYMQPNGIFYLTTDKTPVICTTDNFKLTDNIEYATQSGPMLVINGNIHAKFNPDSPNIHIRNGVGILPNGNLLFAMSKQKINFYDFASYFKHKGCQNALYLDGFVSRTYLPSKNWTQLDGNFGVIIAETESKH